MVDFDDMSNQELESLSAAATSELGRRQEQEAIPGQIADLAARYVAGGGDVADLVQVITVAPPEPVEDEQPVDVEAVS